jgi:hypothetical protein
MYDQNGEKMSEFGDYPAYWNREIDFANRVRGFYHQTFFERHPSKNMFVAYTGHILSIYSFESINKIPSLINEYLLSKYQYQFIDKNFLTVKSEEWVEQGIVTVACSTNFIYIVYNPNKVGSDEKLSYQIKIIDWNGNSIKQLNTNKQITCLAIDEMEKKGYIIAQDPEDTLMFFYLND